MMDHLANIADKATDAKAAMDTYQNQRAALREAMVAAHRADGGPGVNEIIRAAAPGMSKQKVIEALDTGRLQREVMRVLDQAGLCGDPANEGDPHQTVNMGMGRYVHVIHMDGKRATADITKALESAGYEVHEKVLESAGGEFSELDEAVLRVSRADAGT